jgi:REP-associated tyrosine transposase
MRYRRSQVAGACYFFTVVTFRRQRLFADASTIALLDDVLRAAQAKRPFSIDALVVLPDHLHTLWTLPDGDADFADRWRQVKGTFSRAYSPSHTLPEPDPGRKRRGEQTIWQRRYWEHLIRDERDFAAHLDYIHFNPVRHGLAKAPRDYKHSTFRDWVARGAYEIDWASDEPPKLPDWAGRE